MAVPKFFKNFNACEHTIALREKSLARKDMKVKEIELEKKGLQ